MKILDRLVKILAYLSTGTLLAMLIGSVALWYRGILDPHRCYQILAVLYGHELRLASEPTAGAPPLKQVSYEELLERRTLNSLDADLRQTATENALLDMHSIALRLQREKERVTALRTALDRRLDALRRDLQDAAVLEVTDLIESMSAKQAKQQLLRMLDDDQMDQVVLIIRTMSPDKRRKLVAEFETADDADRLSEILREIQEGSQAGELIRRTRDALDATP